MCPNFHVPWSIPVMISNIQLSTTSPHTNVFWGFLVIFFFSSETRSLFWWSLTLREEHRLRVFEGRIFGPKRDEVIGGWRKLHNEELHNLYFSPSIIRMMKSRRIR
jgi:hypothetical protein